MALTLAYLVLSLICGYFAYRSKGFVRAGNITVALICIAFSIARFATNNHEVEWPISGLDLANIYQQLVTLDSSKSLIILFCASLLTWITWHQIKRIADRG